MPQICIIQKNFGTCSSMIQTQLKFGDSLYLSQLKWGISTWKNETNEDVSAVGILPRMIFEDSIGAAFLEEDGNVYSYPRYIIFCLRHFGDMACIYLKHIFIQNGRTVVLYKKEVLGQIDSRNVNHLLSCDFTGNSDGG